MYNLIYYPGFEVEDKNWLKFALLYLEHLNPIIPQRGREEVTRIARVVQQESDLIVPHEPTYQEGYQATLEAIDVVERILRSPENYKPIFHTTNIVDIWTNPRFQRRSLFREKYTEEWMRFCDRNRLAKGYDRKFPDSISLEESLSHIYMSILAQVIAEGRGISTITDRTTLDRFSILSRKPHGPNDELFHLARRVIEIQLPANLEEIDIQSVIKLRKSSGFRTRQKAFHTELEKFFNNDSESLYAEDFVNSFNYVWQEFTKEILQLGTGVATISLAAWVLAESHSTSIAEYLKDAILPTLSIAISSDTLISSWKRTQPRRYTKKFLADLANAQ